MEPTNPTPTPGGNNGKIAGVVIVIILIALVVWYFTSGRSKKDTKSGTETTQDQLAAESPKSLKELLALGKSQKCTYSEANNQGMFYFADGKMRGDFTSSSNAGQTVQSHMMSDSEYMYSWSDGTESGIKIKIDANQEAQSTNQQSSVDVNRQMNYNCSSWSVDDSKFSLPTNIKFQDFNSMMPQGGSGGSGSAGGSASGSVDYKAQQCAACDSLTGDDKTQCKTAL